MPLHPPKPEYCPGHYSPRKQAPAAPPKPRAESGFTTSMLLKVPNRKVDPLATRADTGMQMYRGESYGVIADPTQSPRGLGSSRAHETPPELIFYSWWNEELATPPEFCKSGSSIGPRRQLELRHKTHEGIFQLMTDDARVPLTLRIEHANGAPLLPTELYIGARIDVLGRPTTLQKASARTVSWIDAEAKRLLKRRDSLCEQLAKFCDVHKTLHKRGITRLYLANINRPDERSHPVPGGATNLSRLGGELRLLEELVMMHRG